MQVMLGVGGGISAAPTANCGRFWLMRLGLYELQRPLPHADDWIWIVDHTVQIGHQRCLVIVGVQLSDVVGRLSLELNDLSVIAIEPVEQSNADIVQQQLTQATQRTSAPRLIVSDGCRELKKGIAQFQQSHPNTDTTYDIKHKTALILKKALEKDNRWVEFNKAVHETRRATLPTRFAHLIPPPLKSKARYMNMAPLIQWTRRMVSYLTAPFSADDGEACEVGPINMHFRWILDYQADIAEWNREIDILETATEYCRRYGYHRGMATQLRPMLKAIAGGERSRQVAESVLEFVEDQSAVAGEDENLLATSESIESLFSKGKHLQKQQSASGFTSLLLAVATCVVRTTRAAIDEALGNVKTSHVLGWSHEKLGTTVQAKRRRTLGIIKTGTKTAQKAVLAAA